jgi:hypothetical protein
MKEHDMSKWPIPAFLLMGIGVGLFLVDKYPMAIPSFTLIGLGMGILVTYLKQK